jgi:phospholipid/cholesterol/gamma-HCH transport system ATP-binding protein
MARTTPTPILSVKNAAPKQQEAPPVISLKNVDKSFGSQVVFDGLDLDIYPAQTTVVLGPSGSGKSVMLKHIVRLIRPDKGEIYFDGRRIDDLPERDLEAMRLQVGLLFQSGALFDSMTVAENIAFPMIEHTKLNREQRHEAVIAALRTVDLENVENKLPAQLSGGQRKRVALARAIVLRPRVVLYDEPTTGLDPIRADGINDLIIKLRDRLGATNVVVTHDLSSAHKVADRVVMLLAGKIAADGTFEELCRNPDPRVQHFLQGKYDPKDAESFDMPEGPPTDTLGARDIGI